MKEIGSYFELELHKGCEYHSDAFALNLGRTALRHVARSLSIKRIYVPYYTCECVARALRLEGSEVIFYDIDTRFMPVRRFERDAYVLYTNYFGICGKNVKRLSDDYPNLIVDNTMSFYSPASGRASFYSPRKFFGVVDGAYCYGADGGEDYPQGESWTKMGPLLRRIDGGANAGYPSVVSLEEENDEAQIMRMSLLTHSILASINYEDVRAIRMRNFCYLHRRLAQYNELPLNLADDDVPMKYPLLTKRGGVRQRLNELNIYTPTYWSGMKSETSQVLSQSIVPLTMDQRYDLSDMKLIADVVEEACRK